MGPMIFSKASAMGLALGVAIISPAHSETTSPISDEIAEQITENWADHVSSGDVDSWMLLHAEDVEFANHSWFTGIARDEMRRWGNAVARADGVYVIEEMTNHGDHLIWLIDYNDRSFSIREQGRVEIANGLITKVILGPRDTQ